MISDTNLIDLRGLENVESLGDELSILNNPLLKTLSNLGANVTNRTLQSIRNVGIRSNPALEDLDAFDYIENITGKICNHLIVNI